MTNTKTKNENKENNNDIELIKVRLHPEDSLYNEKNKNLTFYVDSRDVENFEGDLSTIEIYHYCYDEEGRDIEMAEFFNDCPEFYRENNFVFFYKLIRVD